MKESTASDRSPWRLCGNVATLQFHQWSAKLNIARPYDGLQIGDTPPSRGTDHDANARLLQVRAGAQPIDGAWTTDEWTTGDAYVRGCDLSLTYEASDSRPFRLHGYWRIHEEQSQRLRGIVLDAIVSLQTRHWEAYPSVAVGSILRGQSVAAVSAGAEPKFEPIDAGEAPPKATQRPSNCATLIRLDAATSYVEARVADDFDGWRIAMEDAQRCRSESIYRPKFMERGVIRRLTLRVGLVPREGDIKAARSLAAQLQHERPPLTA